MKNTKIPPSMTAPDIPSAMSAQAIESAALGLKMFIDLGKLMLQRDKPQAYRDACASIADGSAVETIIIRIGKDSLAMSFCLLAPESPAAPALFAITGKAVSESMH